MRRSARDSDDSARQINRRALMLGGAMAAMVAVLAGRMRYLQVDQADQFRLLAEENRINIRLIPPDRGLIQDREGRLIAGNEQNYRVVITREDAGDVAAVLQRLASLIPLTAAEIDKISMDVKRHSPFVPVIVADRLAWDDLAKIALNSPVLPGVSPEVGLSRIYPNDTDFAHVVGYVGPVSERDLETQTDPDPLLQLPEFQIGKIGVERWADATLRGRAGERRIEVNAVGRVMRELEHRNGVAGADIRLTIDAAIQNFAQVRLGDESAAAVALDVASGDVLAIASAPSFDPNLFVRGISQKDYARLTEDDHRPLANKAVQGAYPPGSTFKMVTALAALGAGVIDAKTTVRCPGYYELGGRKYYCWKRSGHGTVSLERALAESCDVYFYEVGQKAGIDQIATIGRALGLGQRHDLPMSAITDGLMPDKAWKQKRYGQEWRIGDTVNAAIGQGYVLTSPLQLAVMTARIATGRAVAPRLIHMIDGKLVEPPPPAALGFAAGNLAAVQRGMFAVMNGARGTARGARSEDPALQMAGKTGTAQVRNISAAERASGVISNDQLPWGARDHALFVCYAPFDAPRVAVSVVVEHGGGGSAVAAPIARDILLRCLSDGLPALSAYPASQRSRIDSQFKAMKLRDIAPANPDEQQA